MHRQGKENASFKENRRILNRDSNHNLRERFFSAIPSCIQFPCRQNGTTGMPQHLPSLLKTWLANHSTDVRWKHKSTFLTRICNRKHAALRKENQKIESSPEIKHNPKTWHYQAPTSLVPFEPRRHKAWSLRNGQWEGTVFLGAFMQGWARESL